MRAIPGYIFFALVLGLVGGACLGAGLLDWRMADAQQSLIALDYQAPDQTFATAERYFEYGSRLPWIGTGPLNDVRARRAALRYWQAEYGAVVPQQTDPVASVPADNIELQLVVANALYRSRQALAKDRQTTLEVLDNGIQAYDTVLKNASRQEDAAYNYEYLVRLRDELLKGRRKAGLPAPPNAPQGEPGGPPEAEFDLSKFQIIIPLDSGERETIEAGKAGKGDPIRRKG